MPSLKQLKCVIETGPENRLLREYDTKYADGFVETYIAVPTESSNFTVHLTSSGYIAPGLAVFVFIDGVAQCNRNRRGLVKPGQKTQPSHTDVDFRVRQKEEKLGPGQWMGREWNFAQLNTTVTDTSSTDDDVPGNLGKIEVVVLRCHDAERPTTQSSSKNIKTVTIKSNDRNLGLDGNWDDLIDKIGKPKQPVQSTQEHQPQSAQNAADAWTQPAYRNYYNYQPQQQQQQQQTYWPPYDSRYAQPAHQPAHQVRNYKGRGQGANYLEDTDDEIEAALAESHARVRRRRPQNFADQQQHRTGYSRHMHNPNDFQEVENKIWLNPPQHQYAPPVQAQHATANQTSVPSEEQRKKNFADGLQRSKYTLEDVKNLVAEREKEAAPVPSEGRNNLMFAMMKIEFTTSDLNELVDALGNQEKNDTADGDAAWGNNGNSNETTNDAAPASAAWGDVTTNQTTTDNATTNNSAAAAWGSNDNAASAWGNSNDNNATTVQNNGSAWGDTTMTNNSNNEVNAASTWENGTDNSKQGDSNNQTISTWTDATVTTGSTEKVKTATARESGRNNSKSNADTTTAPKSALKTSSKKATTTSRADYDKRAQKDRYPHAQSYWQNWNVGSTPEAKALKDEGYLAPEEPLRPIPSSIAEKQNISHQVQAGKGVAYQHATARPVYDDTVNHPYAVFVFKYRSKELLKKLLNIEIKEPKADYRKRMSERSKEEILEELMRAKEAAGYSEDSSIDASGSEDEDEAEVVTKKRTTSKKVEIKEPPKADGWGNTKNTETVGAWGGSSDVVKAKEPTW